MHFDKFPNNYVFQMDTWVIPNRFFDKFSIHSNNIRIPERVEEYLEFRYGNWRVENNDWLFRRDDKGFKEADIKSLMEKSLPVF